MTTFMYDSLSRVVEQISPTGGVATMAYNADGELASETDADGRRIAYNYDADGNEVGETWYASGGGVTNVATFGYDADDRQTTASNNVGTYTLAYDADSNVTNVQGLWGTVLTMTYDAAGNRTVVQDSFGGVTTNVYDADGNLTEQEFGGSGQTPMRINLTYNADDELTGETRYSNLAGTTTVATTSRVYDAAGELTNQVDKNGSGTNIASYTWTYDAGGELTSETLNGGTPVSYTYDADGELTGDGSESETYDAEGNRTNTGYSTGAGNELQSDGTWDYSYDAAGNETYKVAISGGETWEYGYDNKNELVKAQLWASDPRVYGTGDTLLVEVDYKYDVWGNLVETDSYPTGTGSPTVTRYAVDGWNPALAGTTGNTRFNVWADLNSSNGLVTRYFHGDQADQLFGRQNSGVQYWYLTDYQGSVRDVLDNSGNVKDAINYDGFGNIISETNSAYRGSYAWTGRLFDVETGLQYNRSRWYDPTTGRWQSEDALAFASGDSNLYRYAMDNPCNGTDPSGEVILANSMASANALMKKLVAAGAKNVQVVPIKGSDLVYVHTDARDMNAIFSYADTRWSAVFTAPRNTFRDQWLEDRNQFLMASGVVGEGLALQTFYNYLDPTGTVNAETKNAAVALRKGILAGVMLPALKLDFGGEDRYGVPDNDPFVVNVNIQGAIGTRKVVHFFYANLDKRTPFLAGTVSFIYAESLDPARPKNWVPEANRILMAGGQLKTYTTPDGWTNSWAPVINSVFGNNNTKNIGDYLGIGGVGHLTTKSP